MAIFKMVWGKLADLIFLKKQVFSGNHTTTLHPTFPRKNRAGALQDKTKDI